MTFFGDFEYSVDREATLRAYAAAEFGGADTCECDGCRNFRVARKNVFPKEFLELLDRLGIDPAKDGEVYHNGRLAPGCHHYGGWYHFVGALLKTADSHVDMGGGFLVWMTQPGAPRLAPLEDLPVVQLEFVAENVRWILNEPEPL
jgi:hypothetical protein